MTAPRLVAGAGATFSGLARFGIPVHASEHVKQGTFYLVDDPVVAGGQAVVVGVRPETEAEFAGRWARWHVRQLYDDAGALTWLGEDLEREPQPGDLQKAVARMTGWLL